MIQYGLEEDEIAAIKNILAQHEEVEQAILYGSRAKGNFKPASDIDLVLKGEKLNITIQSKIANELDDLLLPYIFDLSVFHQISNVDLLEHIERVGILLYKGMIDNPDEKSWHEWVFSDFVDINPSVRLKSSEEYSFVEMKDLTDGQRNAYPSAKRKLSGGARFQDGDTLFARITPCLENGKICQIKGLENGVGFGSTEFLVFRGKEGISDNDFIFYLSRSFEVRKFAEQHLIGTSGRQRVNKEAFGSLKLRLPTIYIQKKIAHILSSLDEKIELNRQTNRTLEEIAKTLFQEMCVPKGDELPDGWKVSKIRDVVKIKHGYAFKGEFFSDEDTDDVLLTPGNFSIGGGFNYSKFKYYRGDFPNEYILSENDLIVTMTDLSKDGDTLGYSALVPVIFGKKLLHNQRLGKIEFKQSDNIRWFLYFTMRTRQYRNFVLGSATGTTVRHTSPDRISDFDLVLPPIDVLNGFNSVVTGVIQKLSICNQQNQLLSTLRNILLPRLINNEFKILSDGKIG